MFIKEQQNTIKQLDLTFRGYKEVASDFEITPTNCTIIANAYINNKETQDINENRYIATLMLYFWKDLEKLYNKLKRYGYTPEDAHQCIYNCIEVACKYKKWEEDKNTNAEACIRRVIKSRGVPAFFTYCNRISKKANYNTLSLNIKKKSKKKPDFDSDSNSEYIDSITKNCCNIRLEKEKQNSSSNLNELIQTNFENKNYSKAILIYVFSFGDFIIDNNLKKDKIREKARHYIEENKDNIKNSIIKNFDNIDNDILNSCLTKFSKLNRENFSDMVDIVFDNFW